MSFLGSLEVARLLASGYGLLFDPSPFECSANTTTLAHRLTIENLKNLISYLILL